MTAKTRTNQPVSGIIEEVQKGIDEGNIKTSNIKHYKKQNFQINVPSKKSSWSEDEIHGIWFLSPFIYIHDEDYIHEGYISLGVDSDNRFTGQLICFKNGNYVKTINPDGGEVNSTGNIDENHIEYIDLPFEDLPDEIINFYVEFDYFDLDEYYNNDKSAVLEKLFNQDYNVFKELVI